MDEDKTHIVKFDVHLLNGGDNKIQMMGVIMDLTGWGLKQSKDLLDKPPGVVVQGLSRSQAAEIIQRIEAAGGTAEMQRTLK